ncbi:MAG: DNA mismatch repair protein MutS [Flavobacteriales bacterium]|nr:DNA mismatch repair protein MutS [Flavobacteriales bacterium]
MGQYNAIKAKHPEALLLFRIGDFYETFGEDAIKTSNILGIVLTARNNGDSKIELAGFPHHSLDTYLPKLVRAGERVAICDQLEDPKATKGIVRRGVTELVTPGVSYNELTLETKKNNFLASVYYGKKNIGISFLDISTGEFLVAEGTVDYIDKLLQSLTPTEVIYQRNKRRKFEEDFGSSFYTFMLDEWVFTSDYANELLNKQFDTKSLKGFGISDLEDGIIASAVALHYLNETQHHQTKHILSISRIKEESYVWMDRFTIRNLELFHSPNENAITLINVLDQTKSAMGARMLRRWLALPLKDINLISERHQIVEQLIENEEISEVLEMEISAIGDLERLISKVATLRINPKECSRLKDALQSLKPIKDACSKSKNKALNKISNRIDACDAIRAKIESELSDNPPVLLHKGNIIREGVDSELDELRDIQNSGKNYLDKMLEREIEATGISSLKISFNNVFGYYLEVRNRFKDQVPEQWIRKQTLVSAERYITEELKEYEHKILSAEDRILAIENKIYTELVQSISSHIESIQLNAYLVSQLDCLLSFSLIAKRNDYVKPVVNGGSELIIKKGRHPVIEKQLPIGDPYIPNDVTLDREKQQIMMITGPNMSGKSALLRQTALIVLMAQIGGFVPAKSAEIGLVDKIFSRVGASDNISMGESTFMVEMNETASILNNLSNNSLILLDEIGRGTSTYDGVSIAWSIAEYLHEHSTKSKTLFATHYHELNEMTEQFDRIKNYNVSVKESGKNIIFIRTLKEGGSEHSFGIHVAKMAGMPKRIIRKAEKILKQLEATRGTEKNSNPISTENDMQMSFFKLDDPILEDLRDEISDLDINTLTPVEALMKLNEIKKLIGK